MALMLAIPEEASAQYYRPQRPAFGYRHRPHAYVGGHLMGMAIANQATDFDYMGHGGGGGLYGGFRLSPFFAIEGNWMITYHDAAWGDRNTIDVINAFYIMSFTADAKIYIPTFGPLEPYFQAGIGFAYTGTSGYDDGWTYDEPTVWASGPTFNAGGGLDFYLGPHLAFGGRLLYRGFYFSAPDIPNGKTNYLSGVSLDLNITYHF
ncbi:MAG: hypothetical protein CSA65_00735 [Proteobacteria bacterium]|nr:MAG: hypothetical protein CSB49_07570 [Pseudomonadota bacterium]PIE19819.1 MAG: hypothetical protein CSA65_00735 [Pseudomonadota bacterium]